MERIDLCMDLNPFAPKLCSRNKYGSLLGKEGEAEKRDFLWKDVLSSALHHFLLPPWGKE